ncbi:GNAT family N-acetyltransferase [Natronorubrum halophilum]|nr:GNAT family N-acetyltransferase [Natronorubrum halophilum]
MMLVDKDHRNEGYGSQLFDRGLEFARTYGGDVVGLDTTSMEEPIYRT